MSAIFRSSGALLLGLASLSLPLASWGQTTNSSGLPTLPPIPAPTLGQPSSTSDWAANAPSNHESKKLVTPLDHYKARVYEEIGSRWYPSVNKLMNDLPVGTVDIQYTIYEDGHVTTKVLRADKGLELLLKISQNAIMESAPFSAFPPALIKQVGPSFTDDFTFSVYTGTGEGNPPAVPAEPVEPPPSGPVSPGPDPTERDPNAASGQNGID